METITGRCAPVLSAEPCCMRSWGPLPDHCPAGTKPPLQLPPGLDRRCGFDHGAGGARWGGVRVDGATSGVNQLPAASRGKHSSGSSSRSSSSSHHRRRRKSESPKPSKSSAPPSSTRSSQCALRHFKFQRDGSAVSWAGGHEPQEYIPSWNSVAVRNWSLTDEVVSFLNSFLDIQEKMFCRTRHEDQRLLFIRKDNGFGNSIQAAISYLVMAALTSRAIVIVGWGDALETVFDTPLAEYTFERLQSRGLLSTDAMKAFYNCQPSSKMECFGITADDQWMWCKHLDDRFSKRIVSVVGCCGNFLPLLMRNPYHGQELHRIFGEHELAIPLYRTLFRPGRKAVTSTIERPNGGRYIAAHVRLFSPAQEKHLVATMGACLNHLLSLPQHEGAALYVAAISKRLINKIRAQIKSNVTVFFHKPPETEQHNERWALIGALKDMWTLSQAQALVLTPWSTFGTYASALGSSTPWELEGRMDTITGRCAPVLSAEPCGMRNWGPRPDHCPAGTKPPLQLPAGLDRRCGFDHGAGGAHWGGVRVGT
eukprot:TRINITY_DN2425_c0_g1_i2.p1 TRINITY_DN2425_c0_g1~~TRINITY_DN2425_c0_g1_i2.p1  ORF type:complete len:559 (-),score=46.37 TRINITY_DN2425_c0_g1_i2:249-1865(-)